MSGHSNTMNYWRRYKQRMKEAILKHLVERPYAIRQLFDRRAWVTEMIAALMIATLCSCASITGSKGSDIVHTEQQESSMPIVSTPVTPLPVTVTPTPPEPPLPGKTVPEGEPLPREPPPKWTPIPDPVIQLQEK